MIQGYYTKASRIKKCEEQEEAQWLHLFSPSKEEIFEVSRTYGFPKDYLTNVLDSDEIARYEFKSDSSAALVTLLYPFKIRNKMGMTGYDAQPFSIVLTDKLIITASASLPSFFDDLLTNDYVENLADQESFVLEVAWLISYTYILYLKEISQGIKALEEESVISNKNRQLYRLLTLKKSLVFIDAATKSNQPVFQGIKSTDVFSKGGKAKKLLLNMDNENRQAEMMIQQYHQLLEQIGDLFSSIISNRLNNLMKVLTSVSIILTVPAIIGALWGMNVRLPFEKNPFAFWILVGITVAISTAVGMILKKKDYF